MTNATRAVASPLIVAAAALRDGDGRFLVQRRRAGRADAGLWEFPGGKVEPGERIEVALVRELREELAIRVDAAALTPIGFSRGEAGGRDLLLLLFLVRTWMGEPRPLAADALAWCTVADLATLAMPSADVPLVGMLPIAPT